MAAPEGVDLAKALPPVGPTKKKTATGTMKRVALAAMSGMSGMGHSARRLVSTVVSGDGRRFTLQRTRSGAALTTEPEILPAMLAMWRDKKVDDLPVAKDLPRLARRIVLVDESDNLLHESPSALQDEDTSLKRSVELTSQLILAVCSALEGEEKAASFGTKFHEVVNETSETSEGETMVKRLLDILGPEASSPTIRVLKTVHQDIVGHCTFQLKQHITSRFMTKDVRTPEGWRILIRVAPDHVMVSHTRREQSIDSGGDKSNHWEFEWELRLLLDAQATEMRHAQLRVTDLFLSQTIDPQLEEDIKRDLLGGQSSEAN